MYSQRVSPRSVQANEQLREQSRERILGAAREVFAEKGFHNATISDITARAGVSRGLITYYFPGKHELAAELLGRYLDGVAGLLDVTGTPDQRLGAMIDGVLAAAAATLPVQRLALSLMTHPSTLTNFAATEQRKDDDVIQLEDGLRGLFAERGAADPALEEVMFRSVMEGVIVKASIYGESYPLERVRARLHELYRLPPPTTPLLDPDPPPVGRLRAGG